MLDHISFAVADFPVSRAFYLKALAPLGSGIVKEFSEGQLPVPGAYTGFGSSGKPTFWITSAGKPPQSQLHIAFSANNRAEVDAFYEAAIAAGGKDNGGPGLRPHYHADYYGAFVIDPDGHNIEAVCHKPE